MPVKEQLVREAIELLQQLIAIPSFSREEQGTADRIETFLKEKGIPVQRLGNNVWARNLHWSAEKPVLLLNSHHDTVRPVQGWQRDPFTPVIEAGKLYGLGSNDAGGSLVALMAAFRYLYDRTDLAWNLIFAATAEEEISGANGIAALLPELGRVDAGIVGEPTNMQMAVAEKGLLVVDAEAVGIAGHAAREEGVNAIYIAMEDIRTIREFRFEKISETLGPVKMTVTQIQAGSQHNVVPDVCRFVIDIRTTDQYTNREVFEALQSRLKSRLTARSFRLNPSGIPMDHPLVQRGLALGLTTFGSPTLSDQALMPFPTVKLGCGDSGRSHTADEFIGLAEVGEGVGGYLGVVGGKAFDYWMILIPRLG